MSDQQDGDSPGRRPAGARPAPTKKRSHGVFRRTGDSGISSTPLATPISLPMPLVPEEPTGMLGQPAVIVPIADTPITPAPLVDSPLTSPRLMATTRMSSGTASPGPFVLSPKPMIMASPMSTISDLPSVDQTSSPGRAFRALQLHTSRAKAASPGPPSPAAMQWSALRQAVKAGQLSRIASPAPSDRSFSIRRIGSPAPSDRSFPLPRPKVSIPKPSRLARFGSRDLPQPVRGAEMQAARKFEADVRDACWASRYARNGHLRQKWSVDNANDAGAYFPGPSFSASNMHLPFVSSSASASSVSLPLSSVESSTTSLGGRRKATMQPQSPPMAAPPAVHLQPLFDVISRYTQIALQAPGLTWLGQFPAESEVLAVLALPFVTSDQVNKVEEQRFAVDCFDLILRTWPAGSQEDTLDRLLWCCEAASRAQGGLMNRLLAMVRTMTMSTGAPEQCTPAAFRACLRGLFSLQIAISPNFDISRVLSNVIRGKWVVADAAAFDEEYGPVKFTEEDLIGVIPLMTVEVLTRMMANDDQAQRQWSLSFLQEYWPRPSINLTDIQHKIYAQVSASFVRASAQVISRNSAQRQTLVPTLVNICQTWVIPLARDRGWYDRELCSSCASLCFTILPSGVLDEQKVMWSLLEEIWSSGAIAKDGIVEELRTQLPNMDPDEIVRLFTALARSSAQWGDLFGRIIPLLFEHLLTTLPQPQPALGALLSLLGEKYPQHFYKPLFTCAGSVKDDVVAVQLATLTAVARVTPNFWVSNSEMIVVALLGDVGSGVGKGKAKEGSGLKWGRTRPGQCVVTLELIHELRRMCGDIPGAPVEDRIPTSIARFAVELENRIAILIDAKEQAVLLPFSQRILLSTVLLYLRKITRSLKGATWLSRVSAWCCEVYVGAHAKSAIPAVGDRNDSPIAHVTSIEVAEDVLAEVKSTFSRIRDIYGASSSSARAPKGSRPMSMFSPLSPTMDLSRSARGFKMDRWEVILSEKEANLRSISANPAVSILSLLVAVNGLLQQEDYALFGRIIWNRFLDIDEAAVIIPSAFLFMQYGERHPEETTALIRNDLLSHDEQLRQRALRRLSHLLSRGGQVLAQFHITDRTHRRPFKGIRQPISFVATDIGASHYVESAEEDDGLDVTAGVAREVKKRLLEIGWVEDENDEGRDGAAERFSLSLVPSFLLNRLGSSSSPSALPVGSQSSSGDGQRPLLRRKSSGSNYYIGVKRRFIFVSSVSASLQYLGIVSTHRDPLASGLAQEILLTSVRDDVSLVGRPIMEMISGEALGIQEAISNLRSLFFAQSAVPPSFAHHVFNHLVGFLKTVSREMERLVSHHLHSLTLPLVSRIGAHVPDMALRDLRRNKVEMLLLPSGSLWFPASAPAGPMFPRSLSAFTESIDGVPLDELKMLALRTTQNMIVLQLLIREPKDVYTFEKAVAPVLPISTASATSHKRTPSGSAHVPWSPWITLGTSYLLVARQLFKSLSSNLNDRDKLANMLEGVNATLKAFPAELGIVTHSMLAYSTAITRFRRLVANNNGFGLFIPTVWIVYKQQYAHSSVRTAVQHAFKFFHNVHGEAFVFQAIDCIATVLGGDATETGSSGAMLYDLFKSLDRSSAKMSDIGGLQEQFAALDETTISLPTEKASRSMATSRSVSADNSSTKQSLPVSVKRAVADFPMENLIRLCLTIIAHDPASPRAPRFLRVLRVLSRKLYQHSTSARDLLRDGIDALGMILSKNIAARLGLVEVNSLHPDVEKPILPTAAESSQLLAFRREYLHLVKEYTVAGGIPTGSSIGKTLSLLRTILKDTSHTFATELAEFLGDYAAACLKPGTLNTRETRTILKDFSQLFQMYGDTVDCSPVLKVVENVVASQTAVTDPSFVDLVVGEWCRPALLICEAAASAHRLWDLPLRKATVGLMSAVIASGNMEVFTLLDVKQPTPSLLGGIILPLVVSMPTDRDEESNRPQSSELRCSQWLRIVSYILPACHFLKTNPTAHTRRRLRKASPSRGEDGGSRQAKDNVRQRLAAAVFAFQVLKVVLLRAADDLQEAPSRIWTFVGAALRELLDGGGADFLLREPDGSPSPSPSRPGSPGESRNSFDNSLLRPNHIPLTPSSNAYDSSQKRLGPPRTLDFLLWTTLELVTSHATPLMPQMRVFVQEKIQQTNRYMSMVDHRMSRSPKRSSVFVRSRASGSPDLSASPQPRQSLLKWSPGSSPSPSPSKLMVNGYFSVEAMSPSPLRPHGARIVHLGPVTSPAAPQAASTIGGQHLASNLLAANTRRSLQSVRICMGYTPLELPAVPGTEDSENQFTPWTRASALARVIEESNVLIELEFHDELLAHAAARSTSLSQAPRSPVKEER